MPDPQNQRDLPTNDRRLYQTVNHTGRRPTRTHGRTVESYTAAATHARRSRANINRGMILLCAMLAFLSVVAVLAIALAGRGGGSAPGSPLHTVPGGQTGAQSGEPVQLPLGLQSVSVSVPTEKMHEGPLILVNYLHAYAFPADTQIISVNKNKSDHYITWFEFQLEKTTLDTFNRMIDDFYAATGCGRTLMNSAYRTFAEQEEIFATSQTGYATSPGYSEHHTGMALDIQIYDPSYGNKKSWYFSEYAPAAWLVEHFDDYGFILRYPEDKTGLTRIEFESWHYRYIGTPHAEICNLRGDCLEEYIEHLEALSFDGTRLYYDGKTVTEGDYTLQGQSGYMIYFVPASAGETTEIPVPKSCLSYEISGDNVSGFIVTARLGA